MSHFNRIEFHNMKCESYDISKMNRGNNDGRRQNEWKSKLN